MGRVTYAIGDVHGELDLLNELHAHIQFDWERTGHGRALRIVHLGDLVDRGRNSKGVVDRLMTMERQAENTPTLEVVALMGNHEDMMLKALDDPNGEGAVMWLASGGGETIASYGARELWGWRDLIDEEHEAWLRARPDRLWDLETNTVYVHAGIAPQDFPDCAREVRIWTRSGAFFDTDHWPDRPELADLHVVHGHTPRRDRSPEKSGRRINVDTGAVYGGPLTAVRIALGEEPRFVFARRSAT